MSPFVYSWTLIFDPFLNDFFVFAFSVIFPITWHLPRTFSLPLLSSMKLRYLKSDVTIVGIYNVSYLTP
jgi:hypothetical protein